MGTSSEKAYDRSSVNSSHDPPVGGHEPLPKGLPSMTDLGIKPQAVDRLLPHLDSFVKWELLRFLHSNPETLATLEDLARYTGRDEMELKPAARALTTAGILQQMDAGEGYEYCLTEDETLRHLIAHLIQCFMADHLVRHAISIRILQARRQDSRTQLPAH